MNRPRSQLSPVDRVGPSPNMALLLLPQPQKAAGCGRPYMSGFRLEEYQLLSSKVGRSTRTDDLNKSGFCSCAGHINPDSGLLAAPPHATASVCELQPEIVSIKIEAKALAPVLGAVIQCHFLSGLGGGNRRLHIFAPVKHGPTPSSIDGWMDAFRC